MAKLIKEDVLRDLGRLWGAAEIRPERLVAVTQAEAKIMANRLRYEPVAAAVGCPWWLVGLPHGLERGYSFAHHLHNGDPLARPTTHVPAGRPVGWMDLPASERTWERSAIDALKRMGWDGVKVWTIPEALFRLEAFNGFGYRLYHPTVPSPYLWAATTAYSKGKYASDGHWDANLVSRQIGAAAILKRLVARGVAFPEIKAQNIPSAAPSPDVISYRKGAGVILSPNFTLGEFDCKCSRCSETKVSLKHIVRLQALRDLLRKPVTITSGFRCARHNAEVGGVTGENGGNVSQHVLGTATDIKVSGLTPAQVAEAAEAVGFDGIGRYRTFTHVDSRGSRARWKG
jgi:lysozyme family protein